MPEEQAFCLLVKIMYDYQFRDLYRDGFDNLHLKLYQLDRLMEVCSLLMFVFIFLCHSDTKFTYHYHFLQEQIPELWAHFQGLAIESHMYASQWFLTLFTAKFPLVFVFRVIDLFLLDGTKTLFQVALGLLAVRLQILQNFKTNLTVFEITIRLYVIIRRNHS